jgi:hypothetical protein
MWFSRGEYLSHLMPVQICAIILGDFEHYHKKFHSLERKVNKFMLSKLV